MLLCESKSLNTSSCQEIAREFIFTYIFRAEVVEVWMVWNLCMSWK